MAVSVRDIHLSGKFDAEYEAASNLLHRLGNSGALTEMVGHHATMEDDGWTVSGGETVTTASPIWAPKTQGRVAIPTPKWRRGSSGRTSVDLFWELLVHPQGWTHLRLAMHTPAHHYRLSQRRAYNALLRQLAGAIRALQAEHSPDEITLSADWNLPLQSARNRRRIERALAGTGLTLIVSDKPTHGRHTIDAHASTMHGTAHTLAPLPGFDHRPVLAVLHRRAS